MLVPGGIGGLLSWVAAVSASDHKLHYIAPASVVETAVVLMGVLMWLAPTQPDPTIAAVEREHATTRAQMEQEHAVTRNQIQQLTQLLTEPQVTVGATGATGPLRVDNKNPILPYYQRGTAIGYRPWGTGVILPPPIGSPYNPPGRITDDEEEG